jgi:glucose-6-phosphate isomerase
MSFMDELQMNASRTWQTIDELAAAARSLSIEALFEREPDRMQSLALDAAGLYLDLSRNRLPRQALDALVTLADESGVAQWRNRMFAGEIVNATEKRAVLHTALRELPQAANAPLRVGGEDVRATIPATLERMRKLSHAVREGEWRGASGRPITDIVNIGIGGSHLGPDLAVEALADFAHPRLACHFLSNIDPAGRARLQARLDPHTTLLIVASKSWRTLETARNAEAMREWMLAGGISMEGLQRHLVGVTANAAGARAFGLSDETIYPFGDWVGGRFSLWSAIGLPVMMAIGPEGFDALLGGAHDMDRHFAQAPLARNAPVLLALVSLWNQKVHEGSTEAIVPYSAALAKLPAFLQQLQMESNGKRVDRDGAPLEGPSASVCWGAPGTDAQHSFFQLLHQGTGVHPVDFVIAAPAGQSRDGDALLANALAQAEALMRGSRPQAGDPLAAHRECPGNRPSNTILLDALTPARLGALLALYEHKTAVLGWLWRINSFDQWGVELGKTLAAEIEPLFASTEAAPERLSLPSRRLLERLRALRQASRPDTASGTGPKTKPAPVPGGPRAG